MTDRTIKLSADLDRANVSSLAQEAAELLASGVQQLVFDASAVQRVWLSSVQMIVSAARSAAAAGVSFELRMPTEELKGAISLAGLNDLLMQHEA